MFMNLTVESHDAGWVERALELLTAQGLVIVPGILSETERRRARAAVKRAESGLRQEIGDERLTRDAGEFGGELRLLMKYDPLFFDLLAHPAAVAILDRYLDPSAVLRFQNGLVIRAGRHEPGSWHMNFRRVLNGYRAALEIVMAIDDMDGPEFLFAFSSHQRLDPADPALLERTAQPVPMPAGSMMAFDSTLWHRQGAAETVTDRLLVTHQFTRHFFKPHFDFVRALGEDVVRALPPRTRRLLGWESRVPASLEEFYDDPVVRRYLPNQG